MEAASAPTPQARSMSDTFVSGSSVATARIGLTTAKRVSHSVLAIKEAQRTCIAAWCVAGVHDPIHGDVANVSMCVGTRCKAAH